MKEYVLTNAKLVSYERLNNSVNGNPKYSVVFTGTNKNDEQETIKGKTGTDYSCGYEVTNFSNGHPVNVTYHYTNSGNCIVTLLRAVK